MTKIQKMSRLYRITFQALFYLIPLSVAFYWVFFNHVTPSQLFGDPPYGLSQWPAVPFSATERLIGFLVSSISVAVIMAGIYQLIKLFRLYEKGMIFSQENIRCIRNLSYVLFAWVVSQWIFDALMSFFMVYFVQHKKEIMLSFGSTDFTALLLGGIILFISWVMNEGRQLQEEQDQVI